MITDLLELVGRACHTADHDTRCARPFENHSAAFGLTVDTDGQQTERWCEICLLEDPRRALTTVREGQRWTVSLDGTRLGRIIAHPSGEYFDVRPAVGPQHLAADSYDGAVDLIASAWGWRP